MSGEKHLSMTERVRLEQCERIIERGKQTFMDVGAALMSVRDGRLYRATHATFEDYCRERWGWSKTHVNRQIQAAEIASHLTPRGVKPEAEKHLRPLAGLEPEEQTGAWEEALQTAPAGRVTARHVRAVVDRRRRLDPERQAKVDRFKARMEREDQEAAARHREELSSDEEMGDLLRRVDDQILRMREAARRFSQLALSGGSDNEVQNGMLNLLQRYVQSFQPVERQVEVAHNLIKALRLIVHRINGEEATA